MVTGTASKLATTGTHQSAGKWHRQNIISSIKELGEKHATTTQELACEVMKEKHNIRHDKKQEREEKRQFKAEQADKDRAFQLELAPMQLLMAQANAQAATNTMLPHSSQVSYLSVSDFYNSQLVPQGHDSTDY
jgi:hypothetical protein